MAATTESVLYGTPVPKTVSLLVPFFNHSRYIPGLMEQAANQTVPFSEVICFDDASTDGSGALASRARVIKSRVNRRQCYGRNRLLEAAASDYVHFHDVDDPIHPRFIERMSPLLRPDTVVICSLRQVKPDGSDVIHHTSELSGMDPRMFALTRYIHLNSAIFPKQLVSEVGGFDEALTLFEEKLLFQKLAFAGARFAFVDETLAEWVMHGGSYMHAHTWFQNARMLERYAMLALDMVTESEQGSVFENELAQYLFRKCFEYYRFEPRLFPVLVRIIDRLKSLGHRHVSGMGGKLRVASAVVSGGGLLKLHKRWSGNQSMAAAG